MNSIKEHPQVLLVGNGINRAYDLFSWEDFIGKIQTRKLTQEEIGCLKKVPYPLQPVILTEDNISEKMKEIAECLCSSQPVDEEVTLIQQMLSLPIETILTTNYTYEIEKAICREFECKVGRSSKYRKKVPLSAGNYEMKHLHTYFFADKENPPVWHIHGEAAKPDTMVLGHYYYGKLLAKIQHYVSKLMARYNNCISKGQEFNFHSWVDYFLLGDVYIVGLGMELSEMDLWWLVNCKKRHFSDRKTVLYKPDIKKEEELLAEAYGVKVIREGLKGEKYKNYYKWVFEDIGKCENYYNKR